jgi:anti-sigma-K factor RskA
LPAFVVGVLDPDEMLEVEEYIHAHPELLARVHDLELAAAKLAYAAPKKPLSKDVHAKVMNRARASLPPRSQPMTQPVSQGATTTRVEPSPTRPVQRVADDRTATGRGTNEGWLASWWRRRGFLDLSLAGALAAVLILAVLYRGALGQLDDLRGQVQELDQQVATIQAQNNVLQLENVQLRTDLETRQNQLASLAGAEQMVALGGTEAAPGASGRLYVHDNVGTLVLSNLEQLSEDQIYQLWLIPPDGAPIPAGLLGQAGEPVETITLPLPTSLDTIAAVGVSVEPPGGSDAPTGPIVLLGEKA